MPFEDLINPVEEDILEEQQEMNAKEKLLDDEDVLDGKVIYVEKQNPDISTSYKDRLVRIYDELNVLNENNLAKQIEEIKEELKKIILEIEENDKAIKKNFGSHVDEKLEKEKDYIHLPRTKQKIIKIGNEPVFTITNILLLILITVVLFIGCVIMFLV